VISTGALTPGYTPPAVYAEHLTATGHHAALPIGSALAGCSNRAAGRITGWCSNRCWMKLQRPYQDRPLFGYPYEVRNRYRIKN